MKYLGEGPEYGKCVAGAGKTTVQSRSSNNKKLQDIEERENNRAKLKVEEYKKTKQKKWQKYVATILKI